MMAAAVSSISIFADSWSPDCYDHTMTGEMETALAAADAGRDLLAADTIPDENQSLTCFSCETPMIGLYCHVCGNKNDDYRRSIWRLAVDFFTNFTAMDNRMWRSLWSLLRRPGRMAREYADGARTRWTSPVRFYLATSLILFGYIALSGTQLVALGPVDGFSEELSEKLETHTGTGQTLRFFARASDIERGLDQVGSGPGSAFFRGLVEGLDGAENRYIVEGQISDIETLLADETLDEDRRDALQRRLAKLSSALDALDGGENGDGRPSGKEPSGNNSIVINGPDGSTTNLDSSDLENLYQRVLRRPDVINRGLNNRLKLALFFMLPFAMLLGAVFIRSRRNAMLYDHLVHAAYIHGFSFLLLTAFLLLLHYTPMRQLLLPYTLILLLYLPISARGMFGRGWFKSVLTAYGVGAMYSLVILTVASVLFALELSAVVDDMQLGESPVEAVATD